MSDVALDPAPTTAEIWQPMQESVAEFRSECSDLESMIQGLFEDLDRLRVELERKAMELEHEKQRNSEHEGLLRQQCEDAEKLTQHLQAQEERLGGSIEALQAMRDHFTREREESSARSRELDEQSRVHIQRLEQDTQQLRKQLEESAGELRLMTRSTVELADARDKLNQAQGEILNLREQLHNTTASNVDAKLVSGLEQERDELRDEVELLRERAAELSQNLVDQKVEMDRQRDELTNELKHLRKFVEMQTEMMMHRSPGAAPTARSSDAVTSAVMAQFSKVQRDASERRKGRTGT